MQEHARRDQWSEPLAIKINTSAEATRVFKSLADDVVDASIFYRLYGDLLDCVPQFERELNASRVFWHFTFAAYRDALLLRLVRLYEVRSDVIGLHSWLETVRDAAALFRKPTAFRREPTEAEIERDLRLLDTKSDPLLRRLKSLRNKIVVHRDSQNVVDQLGLEATLGITYEECGVLIDRAERVLNRYGTLLRGEFHLTRMRGHDDYMLVLNAIRADLDRREEAVRFELRRLRARRLESGSKATPDGGVDDSR